MVGKSKGKGAQMIVYIVIITVEQNKHHLK